MQTHVSSKPCLMSYFAGASSDSPFVLIMMLEFMQKCCIGSNFCFSSHYLVSLVDTRLDSCSRRQERSNGPEANCSLSFELIVQAKSPA